MLYHMIGGAIVYSVAVAICYWPVVRNGPYYFPIGIACGVIANALWLHLAKGMNADSDRMVAGLYWDSMIVAVYILIPLLMFGVRVSWTTALGLVFIVAGIALTKF